MCVCVCVCVSQPVSPAPDEIAYALKPCNKITLEPICAKMTTNQFSWRQLFFLLFFQNQNTLFVKLKQNSLTTTKKTFRLISGSKSTGEPRGVLGFRQKLAVFEKTSSRRTRPNSLSALPAIVLIATWAIISCLIGQVVSGLIRLFGDRFVRVQQKL